MCARERAQRLPSLSAQALLAMEAPTGSSRYDMVCEILAAAQAAPDHAPESGPVHGAICFLRELVGMDAAPVGEFVVDLITLVKTSCPFVNWTLSSL
jgi:hypothetical protein